MKYWQRIEEKLGRDGVRTIISKLIIKDSDRDHDLYIKVGWWRGRPVHVDITLGMDNKANTNNDTLDVHSSALPMIIDLRRRILDNSRAYLELVCREASLLLSSRRCSLLELADLWRVTEMEPRGRCPKVKDELGDRVHGPLDAAAKLFQIKREDWEKQMAHEYKEEEIERMLSDCKEAIDDRSDEFTEFEVNFIESLDAENETTHLSERQISKLEQIWEERNCG